MGFLLTVKKIFLSSTPPPFFSFFFCCSLDKQQAGSHLVTLGGVSAGGKGTQEEEKGSVWGGGGGWLLRKMARRSTPPCTPHLPHPLLKSGSQETAFQVSAYIRSLAKEVENARSQRGLSGLWGGCVNFITILGGFACFLGPPLKGEAKLI